MSKKDERRYGSWWICPNCKDNPEFEHKAMMVHIKKVHGINPATVKGRRSMVMHLDGDTWFSWQYEWEINGLKFHQYTCDKRSKYGGGMWR